MKITKAWRALAVGAMLGGAAVVCPMQAYADSAPAADQEKKSGDIIVQPPIIIPDKKKK
ncbi:MAG: hypothetical protein ABIY70_05745 [Capsulimonas sp.]|jgi:hypothetical protein|uniref:hypothetical protein n=1 Tax=Capsulimonas sp. TaxID=2494211 RepID=UPI00326307A5|nr:hypothetical protein [Capsulimonas sp.]